MKEKDLTIGSTKKLFFGYLIPSISATLVTSIYVLADTIMIGKGIGAVGIAALNIVLPLYAIFFGLGSLFGVGGAVFMSVAQGGNDYELGRKYFTTSVVSLAISAVTIILLFSFGLGSVLRILGASDATYDMAYEYAYIVRMGIPFFMFNAMMQAFVRNDRDPNLAMIAVISGGVVNTVVDWIFIYPCDFGMAGAAAATVIGNIVTLLILMTHLFKKSSTLKMIAGGFTLKRTGKIIANGFASFLVEMANGIITFLFNIQLVRYIGDLGVSVYGIIANAAIVVLSLANGVAQAAQPILAVNFGASKEERVKQIRRLGLLTTIVVGTICGIAGICFPKAVTNIFIDSTPEILELAIPAIRTYFVCFVFMNINIFASNYCQSVMRANHAMTITILRGFVFSTLFVMLLPMLLSAEGIWLSMPIAEGLTAVVSLYWLKKKVML